MPEDQTGKLQTIITDDLAKIYGRTWVVAILSGRPLAYETFLHSTTVIDREGRVVTTDTIDGEEHFESASAALESFYAQQKRRIDTSIEKRQGDLDFINSVRGKLKFLFRPRVRRAVIAAIHSRMAKSRERLEAISESEIRHLPDDLHTHGRFVLGSTVWVLLSDEPGIPVLEAVVIEEHFNPPSLIRPPTEPIAFSYTAKITSQRERYQVVSFTAKEAGMETTIYGASIWFSREDAYAERRRLVEKVQAEIMAHDPD